MQLAATRIGPRWFHWGQRTYVMGIINVTPDSFSGDGVGDDPNAAVARAEAMVAAGADLIDVGGESTRPGATPVDVETELARVLPVVQRLVEQLPVPISVDTTKPAVAAAALAAGATILNDIHGLRAHPEMARLAARHEAAVVVMANMRGYPHDDIMTAVLDQLRQSIAIADRAGIPPERVIVDPGFGFGTTPVENLTMVRSLHQLKCLGRPILIGPSRKSTIGLVLDLPVHERVEGTAATITIAIDRGADVVRVHDVPVMVRVARMADAITRGWTPPGE
jgi:dihydropteroate synthase